MKQVTRFVVLVLLAAFASACTLQAKDPQAVPLFQEIEATATETIPPSTPLPTLTPSRTLLPPPTFEPPTLTPFPSNTPVPTLTATFDVGFSIEGLNGLETPTPTGTPGCEPRKD